jgi:hypothetical protein
VESKAGERNTQREAERFGHVALTGERRADLVAEVRALEASSHDLAQVDAAQDRSVRHSADQEAREVCTAASISVGGELTRSDGRRGKSSMKSPARAVQPGKLFAISGRRWTQDDACSSASDCFHRLRRR